MRMFEVEPNGNTPLHNYNWEHEVFILEEERFIVCGSRKYRFKEGYAILTSPDIQ